MATADYSAPLRNPFEPMRILSDDQIGDIHDAAVHYLADHGIKVLLEEARRTFADHGDATVDDDSIVRLDPDVVAQALDSAPSQFNMRAPNPARDLPIGGNALALLPAGGPPFVSDLDHGRRPGTMADQENFLRLTQTYDVLAATTPCAEPTDVALNIRHRRGQPLGRLRCSTHCGRRRSARLTAAQFLLEGRVGIRRRRRKGTTTLAAHG